MKSLRLLILLLVSPLTFYAQELTGLWTGVLSNDSISVRQDQSFEIALTEYRGKVYGYSRSTFIVNDTLYYIVKRVKGTIGNNVCEVKDDEIVSCNFPKRLEKGVKVIHTFRLNETDSTWRLDGEWKTTQTKKYYSISGKSDLDEEKDIAKSKIFPHLEELNLAKEMPFYVAAKKREEEAIAQQKQADKRPVTAIHTEQQTGIAKNGPGVSKPGTVKANTVPVGEVVLLDERAVKTGVNTEQQTSISKTSAPNVPAGSVKTNTVPVDEVVLLNEKAKTTQVDPEEQAALARNNSTKPSAGSVRTSTIPVDTRVAMPEPKTQAPPVVATQPPVNKPANNTVAANNTNTVTQRQAPVTTPKAGAPVAVVKPPKEETKTPPVTDNPVIAANKPASEPVPATTNYPKNVVENAAGAAMLFNERKTDAQQTVEFKTDSIVIAVYDNGEIDGDTVSVLLDGQVVLAKQGLKASASKKTLYLGPGAESFSLVLYAENLGKYPPNTGLLVIYDGDDRHYVRFSADLQKNAGVVLRRKR